MIVVSGTKRSGTSMWMQVLHEAGLPVIGDEWPRNWDDVPLREANAAGFYESTLRHGVNFLSNPDPETGVYLHPAATRTHAVKVFLPGLTRTDHAFLHRVIVTVREWRAYAASVARLHQLDRRGQGRPAGDDTPTWDHVLEWWLENFLGLRDILRRRYPCHVVSYESIVAHAGEAIPEVLAWLDVPAMNVEAAVAAVDPALAVTGPSPVPDGVPEDLVPVFDELYGRIHDGVPLDRPFVDLLNQTHDRLAPYLFEHAREAQLARDAGQ